MASRETAEFQNRCRIRDNIIRSGGSERTGLKKSFGSFSLKNFPVAECVSMPDEPKYSLPLGKRSAKGETEQRCR